MVVLHVEPVEVKRWYTTLGEGLINNLILLGWVWHNLYYSYGFCFSSPELFWSKSVLCSFVCPHVVNFSYFQLLQNHCMPSCQTYHKCSFSCPEEVLYLFEANPRCLFWPLIDQDIFVFFSRTTACEVNRLAKNALLEVPKKCCCF